MGSDSDFKSMYPSIMIGKTYVTQQELMICSRMLFHLKITKSHLLGRSFVTTALGEVWFQTSEDPHVTERCTQGRNTNASDGTAFLPRPNAHVKILMNSFTAYLPGFYRFTHRQLGESITAWARQNIKTIIQKLGDEGQHVVYSDTDSIFVKTPVDGVTDPRQAMIEFGHSTAERFSEKSAELEFETGMSVFFSHGAKKRSYQVVCLKKKTRSRDMKLKEQTHSAT